MYKACGQTFIYYDSLRSHLKVKKKTFTSLALRLKKMGLKILGQLHPPAPFRPWLSLATMDLETRPPDPCLVSSWWEKYVSKICCNYLLSVKRRFNLLAKTIKLLRSFVKLRAQLKSRFSSCRVSTVRRLTGETIYNYRASDFNAITPIR